ncbi:MAG TPA: DegV family protein [Gammaproteobacteria bacterium]|nr:DegV family protein [Gammaproteobacteria bacterium]
MHAATLPRVAYLDGARLRRGLMAGIHRVISRQDYLNRINVFPVPDGDTGTNIAFTLNSILAGMAQSVERHVGRLLAAVADAALDGARGNSGAILAQFFQGFSDAASDAEELTLESFASAVKSGAEYARDALAEPREGTLVSVLRDFAEALADYVARTHEADFLAALEHGLARAEVSLADTPNHLAVLKKAGVVDAGAQGFVDLVRGVVDFAKNGSLRSLPPLDLAHIGEYAEQAVSHEADLSHRYCTECVITGEDIDRRKLRERLTAIGSSLVIAGGKSKVKVHVHVNEPGEVFRIAGLFGHVSGQKADDMRQQSREAAATGERGVAIITDSGADIPDELLDQLNIHVVPVRVHFGDHGYLDKVSLTADEFYELLRTSPHHPKTSQPAPGDFRRQFQFLGSHYDAVVSINLTSRVSGTCQAAQSAAARTDGVAVTVIDSRNVSAGQGLLVAYAAECARAGMDAPAIVAAVETMRNRTFTFGVLRDLTYAVRGGRVAASKKVLADLLKVTPVLKTTPDGRVTTGGVLFGRRNPVEQFARFVARRANPSRTWRVLVCHANCPSDGARLLDLLRRALPRLENAWLVDLGSALGAHAGPGALVVGLQDYEPPRQK